MMNSKKSSSVVNIASQQWAQHYKPVIGSKAQQVYSSALCDSGINSLNSKAISTCDQSDSFSKDRCNRRLSHFRSRSIEEKISESIKILLQSDEAQSIGKVDHFSIKDSRNFVSYVNNLLIALENCMTANENCTQNEPHYDQMRRRYIALRWKSDTIRTLLKEYEELVEKTGGKTAKPPLSASKSRSFSFHNIWRIGKRSPRENLTPLSANITNDSFRMQEIENHIADLSGSIHFQANTNVLGSNCPTISSSYQLRLNITQADPERSSSILNLPSYSRTPELFGGSSANILASPLHEWNFTVRRRRSRPSIFKINEPSTFQSDTEPWEFSSTESFLPMEPCATLIADVTADKKRLRKSLDLMQFLTPESQTISIEFTVMSTPCLILEVRWMPFTRLDLAALEKFPVSQFLSMDWYSSFEESSQGSNGALMIRDRRVRGLSPPPESERDWDGGFESMNLRDIMTSNDKLGLPHVKEQWQVQSNEATRDVPSPLIDECTTETSLFQYQQNIFGENENYPEENESSGDKEGDMTCHDEEDLSYLINTAQQRIKNINRYPNRYREILEELSVVIKTLHEQLTTSRKFSTTSLSKRKLSPRKMDSDLRKSLSELDLAIGESPSNFTSAVESWTTPLSTGWDDLDSAIEWHLQNVSLLLEKLACSERIFIGTSDSEGSKNNILLSIREDLIAMALDSQSEILSDITGLIFSYSESKEPLTVVLQSHCLAYCGMMDRGYQNSQSGTHSPLFPTSFWTNFVWQNAPTSNLLLNSASTNRLSTSRENIHPSIMIDRESLQAYLLKEYVIPSSNEDEQALHIAIDTLIEQITDNDLTDASPSREIPLTQLCHRLKPQNFKVLTHFVNLKPGTFNTRARVLIPRPTQSTAPSIGLALQYLIQQAKLQLELRESDEEVLFRSLESLVDSLVTQDRRNELMNMSLTSFLCLALTLQHEDDSVATFASRAICALEDSTRSAYGVILQSNQLPFLRTSGPCCSFLKSLTTFNQKIRSGTVRAEIRENSSSPVDRYKLLSPVGSTILWIMQVYGVEEYRIAALAAWECISAPAEASIGRSSSAYKELAHESTRAHRGHNDDQEPIQAEIWTMNLSDDSGKVRRKALRILRAYKKSRSTACCLDVPP